MDLSEYIVTFYSIFVGFAACTYIVGWGNMIKEIRLSKPYWGQLTWTLAFFSLMLNDWWVQYKHMSGIDLHPTNLITMLFQPTMVYFIGILIFPDPSPNAPVDHFAHFEKHKRSIMLLTVCIIAKIYIEAAPSLGIINRPRLEALFFMALVGAGIWIKPRWYAEMIGSVAMLFWIWRFWIMG